MTTVNPGSASILANEIEKSFSFRFISPYTSIKIPMPHDNTYKRYLIYLLNNSI